MPQEVYGLSASDIRMFRELAQRVRSGDFDRAPGVNYRPSPNPILVKTVGAHDKGDTQAVAIYSGSTKGGETDTGLTVDAYNRFAGLADDKWALAFPVDAGWELWAGEC